MEKNKTGKYFKYAIGEIVLVVIGILIALSINNWNENRKLQNEEINLLSEVKSNLETTLQNFKIDTLYNYQTIVFYERINHYIESDLPYNTELDSAFAALSLWSTPYAQSIGYKTLEGKGLDIIKNKEIRNSIVNLYEVKLQSLFTDIDKSEWALSDNVIVPFVSKNIRRINKGSLNRSRPNDFESLKNNQEFINIISMLIRQRKIGLMYYRDTIRSLENLIADLDIELNSRS